MERVRTIRTIRNVENLVISKTTISELLTALSARELDVLWDLAKTGLTIQQIADRNGLSISQCHTIRSSLARKAIAILGK